MKIVAIDMTYDPGPKAQGPVPREERGCLHPAQRSAYPAQPTVTPFPLPPPGGTWYGFPAPGTTHKNTLQGAGGRTPNPQSQHHRATPPQEAAGETALLPSLPSLLRGWKRRGGRRDHIIPLPPVGVRGGPGPCEVSSGGGHTIRPRGRDRGLRAVDHI